MCAYDLHVDFPQQLSGETFTRIQNLAVALGYSGLAINSPSPLPMNNMHKSLEIFHRMTLAPRSPSRLRFSVEKQLHQTDLLIIHGRSKSIWLAAAEIPSIHMVMLKDIEDFMVIDSQVARAMANYRKPVEVCLHNLLVHSGSSRSRFMRVMNAAINHLVRANCALILTSGATHPCELRAPKDLEALSFLASVPEEFANNAMNHESVRLVSTIRTAKTARSSASPRRAL